MNNTQLGIHQLSYDDLTDHKILHEFIYPDMFKNYYWSDDFSAKYYIAKAKAGFIAITDYYEEEELLLPEIQFINKLHRHNWLTPKYLNTLKASQGVDENFKVISALIRDEEEVVAGEIGYMIGKTYTSLSGFSKREKEYHNYGTTQLVLLALYLQKNGFAFWNLGQSYMPYKLMLGAKIFEREDFLKRWYVESTNC
jgi:hypothetical protein